MMRRWFQTIRARVLGVAVLGAVLLVVLGGTAYLQLARVEAGWQDYLGRVEAKQRLVMAVRRDVGYGGMIHHFKNYVLRGPRNVGGYYERFKRSEAAVQMHLDAYRAIGLVKEEAAALDEVGRLVRIYSERLEISKAMIEAGETRSAVIDEAVVVDDGRFVGALVRLDAHMAMLTQRHTQGIDRAVAHFHLVLGVVVLFAVALFPLLAYRAISPYIAPLDIVREGVGVASTGDLTGKVDVWRGGETARQFTVLLEHMRGSVRQFKGVSEALTASATAMMATSGDMVMDAHAIHGDVSEAATAVGEMRRACGRISGGTERWSEAVTVLSEGLTVMREALQAAAESSRGPMDTEGCVEMERAVVKAMRAAEVAVERAGDVVSGGRKIERSVAQASGAVVEISEAIGQALEAVECGQRRATVVRDCAEGHEQIAQELSRYVAGYII